MLKFQLVVSCSQSKSVPESESVRFGKVRGKRIHTRLASWSKLVDKHPVEVAARELYSGQYWKSVRELEASLAAKGCHVSTTIISAGFGIVRAVDKIVPYSATFQSNTADCILPEESDSYTDYKEAWLEESSEHFWGKRRLSLINQRSANAITIVLLSPVYLRAASKQFSNIDPRKLLIFSARNWAGSDYNESIVSLAPEIQSHLGGGRVSLGPRMAKSALLSFKDPSRISPRTVRSHIKRLKNKFGEETKTDRSPVSDTFVENYIKEKLVQGYQNHTPMLRELRDSGFACEYTRFREIFRAINSKTNEQLQFDY